MESASEKWLLLPCHPSIAGRRDTRISGRPALLGADEGERLWKYRHRVRCPVSPAVIGAVNDTLGSDVSRDPAMIWVYELNRPQPERARARIGAGAGEINDHRHQSDQEGQNAQGEIA